MKKETYTRGEIYHVNFSTDCTYCLQGPHPAFVVDHTLNNIRVIPITGVKLKGSALDTSVLEPNDVNGLSKKSILLYHQITTISYSQIMYKMGNVNTEMANVIISELVSNLNSVKP